MKVAIDKIQKENAKLREAIKRSEAELESQSRELKIEAALEKVRAVAMRMKKPDDMLNICRVISRQLKGLKVNDIRNVQTAIFYKQKGIYVNYEFYTLHDKTVVTEVEYNLQPDVKAFVNTLLKDPQAFFTTEFKGAKLKKWIGYQKKANQFVDPHLYKVRSLHYYFYSIGPGALGISTYAPLGDDELAILKRFRNVFELAYKRFIDIEQALAQVREAKMEASLEKVRAQALGMRRPEDIARICEVLYKELQTLGFSEMRNAMVNIHNDEKRTFVNYDYSDEIGKSITPLTYDTHPVIKKQVEQIRSADDAFSETVFRGNDLKKWKEFRKGRGEKEDKRIAGITELYYYFYSIGTGSIGISTFDKVSGDKLELLKRFRNVFAFAYRRYMDIAQAESQAYEAKIELGLERVRAKAMAMQNSNELSELVSVVFKELTKLDFTLTSCIIWIHDDDHTSNTLWIASAELNKPAEPFHVQPFYDPFFRSIIHAWKSKDPKWIFSLKGTEKKIFEKAFFKELPGLPEALRKALKDPEQVVFSASFNNFGALEIVETEALTDEKFDILHRFGKVFDLSYTRFNDLKKAEAQAREANIEAALERVRSRAMAMQTSEELNELIGTVFTELTKLDLVLTRCVILINEGNENGFRWWMANSEDPSRPSNFFVKYSDMPFFNAYLQGWNERQLKWQYILEGKNKIKIDDFLFKETELSLLPDFVIAGMRSPYRVYLNASFNNFGNLTLASLEPLSGEHFDILLRFAKVFDLTYTRFNDLKQAEAQAREAQIEAALERVRSRSMAMQKSDELKEVIQVVYDQFVHLNIKVEHSGFVMDYKERDDYDIWIADPLGVPSRLIVPYFDSVYYNRFNEAKEKGEDFFATNLAFEEKNTFYQKLFEYVPGLPEESKQFYFSCPGLAASTVLLENVCLYIENFSGTPYTEDENNTLMRFGKVFQQTYTRFLDLQKAEAQARESQIEASLERVRSKAMSMQKSEDLAMAVATVFEELDKLDLGMLRCGIGILNKEKRCAQVWTTTISDNDMVVHVTGDESMDIHPLLRGAFDAWLKQVDYSYVLKDDDLKRYYKAIAGANFRLPDSQSLVEAEGKVQYYYNAMFTSGGLFAFRDSEFPEEAKIVLRRFADVFNLTYTRFNDLKVAEAHAIQAEEDLVKLQAEKKRAEVALAELRATQAQLIQSEKMASLGELTAGIAHEIQNPLNFVNNFSEVSNELIEELKGERLKAEGERNTQFESDLLDDIFQNLQKINEHGKRADAIVKGMLQHSRSSSGKKEPTDINALADEYLRLSYHGLRAKDKSFNAEFITQLDASIKKINVIPQDMGRVLLNLFNNAFYAVNERSKNAGGNYKPKVELRTQNEKGNVIISVKDNGNGIPQNILDKIFQPFFTTKPTGQGTGLGLSLSYDIVKAHGGHMKVQTREGEFTEFIIQLTSTPEI